MYYDEEELACNCCGELPEGGIDPNLLALLDEMSEIAGYKLPINCGYRCPGHNRQVYEELGLPVVENSQHVMGTAADVDASNIGVDKLAEIAENCGADGIGFYYDSCFVHVDVRDGRIGEEYRWEG